MANPVSRVLDWLHAGYPDGIPPRDYTPLLALLTRTLSESEVDEIVASVITENPDGRIAPEAVHESIEQRKRAAATPEDVHRVAGRLAAVGWPLSDSPDDDELRAVARAHEAAAGAGTSTGSGADGSTVGPTAGTPGTTGIPGEIPPLDPAADRAALEVPSPNAAQRVISWLTEGYPDGIPATDRVPLMALLRRRLTDEEVEEVAARLIDDARAGDIDTVDAGTLITRYTDELPAEQDMARLASHLAEKGWPLRAEG